MDCHSNQTSWPWYSGIAPLSWVIADDVKRARQELNFSEWGKYDPAEKAHLLKEARELIELGHMPPPLYSLFHRDSRLSEAEVRALSEWAERQRQLVLEQQ
jgi:hypothetical protein